jgi:FkbM family methyltransferase
MLGIIYKLYGYLFARNIFRKLNMFLYHISLRGLGVLNYQGEYLTGEKGWLRGYLKDKVKPIVLDVGANVGNYSKNVLSSNASCSIFAFEPHPVTFKKLVANTTSSQFKAFNVGVGIENGTLSLYDYDTKDGSAHASLYKDVIKDLHRGNPISHSVDIIALDQFLISQNIQAVDLLKIDTEGNEFNVLLGCKEFLNNRKIKAIHFEFNEMNIVSKVSFKDFWDYLKEYELYRILPGGKLLKIKKYSPFNCEIYAFQNIVAILKEDCS